jgi:hypothetical protein
MENSFLNNGMINNGFIPNPNIYQELLYSQTQHQVFGQPQQQQLTISAQQLQKEKEDAQLRTLLLEQLKAAGDLAQKVVNLSTKVLSGDDSRAQSLAAEARSCSFQLAFLLEGVKIDV